MESYLETMLHDFLAWFAGLVPTLLAALGIAAIGWFGSIWLKRLIDRAVIHAGWDEITWGYIGTVVRYIFLVTMLIAALKRIGFPVESLMVSIGVTGIIIGMGARRSIANYFAGLMMMGAKPFDQGDLIEFGPPQQIGFVLDVNMSYTGLVTLDNAQIVVPNSVLWRNKIINHSRYEMHVLQITLAVDYSVDLDWVRDLALDLMHRHEAILEEPAPRFKVLAVAANEIKTSVVGWTTAQTVNLYGELISALRQEFAEANLAVTIPAQDISPTGEEYLWRKGGRSTA